MCLLFEYLTIEDMIKCAGTCCNIEYSARQMVDVRIVVCLTYMKTVGQETWKKWKEAKEG